ncbi:MAG TPA: cysteine synthase family protein [Caldithrix abyssi]|uniref:Cysteine synthase family protein n=1 Tax=Caldithrix abyssi TaxID=187145 RepID=A0A7V4U1B1_CALAY|nr:cysteine synthase family protein [Caldithrix abyssi]
MSSLLDAIGNTPLIRLNKITKHVKAQIWAKLEFLNPGGSIKDRIAKYMIENAERQGKLRPGDTIIENSSGNTAMGLAIVSLQKGYKCKIVIRDTTSIEKIKMLRHLGAETILVDADIPPEEENSYNNYAKKIAETHPDSFYIDQHNNPDNNEAHYKTTGPEIWRQTKGRIDYLIAGIGTGGTLCGAGRYLKEQNPDIKIIGVDPVGSVFYDYFKHKKRVSPRRYKLEGLGDEFLLPTVQFDYLDDIIRIDDETAFEYTRKLARTEGIIAGGSSGAAIYGALKLAEKVNEEATIVTIFPDSGYKYFSTIFS